MLKRGPTLRAQAVRRSPRRDRFDRVGSPGSSIRAGGRRRVCARPQRTRPVRKDPAMRPGADRPPAHGTRYRPVFKAGQQLPTAIRLDDGALLIEFHPSGQQNEFQILTPLAIAAVRGTKWAMEVAPARTSTLVLDGSVAVTSRRLNQYVVLTEGQGVDISPSDTSMVQKAMGGSQDSRPSVALRGVDAV